MFIKKCDFKCIKILAKCDTRTEYVYTVVTSLLLVFDYHARNTLTLYYLYTNKRCLLYRYRNRIEISLLTKSGPQEGIYS